MKQQQTTQLILGLLIVGICLVIIVLIGMTPEETDVPSQPALIDSWETIVDTEQQVTFQYPDMLTATYISTSIWPPTLTLTSSDTLICNETPQESSFPIRTAKRLVDQKTYCIHAISEGAAGSVYTDYTYTTMWNDMIASLQFTLQYPRCENYDDPQQTVCSNEREAFDIDGVVHRILQTLTVQEGKEVMPAYTPITTATYVCDAEKTIHATYYKGPDAPTPQAGEPPTPTGKVEVLLDGTLQTLFQTISASGVRYANTDESLVFWSKGDEALVMRNNEMDLTYTNCITR